MCTHKSDYEYTVSVRRSAVDRQQFTKSEEKNVSTPQSEQTDLIAVTELARELAGEFGLHRPTVHGEIQWLVHHVAPNAYDGEADTITESAAEAVRDEYRRNSMP